MGFKGALYEFRTGRIPGLDDETRAALNEEARRYREVRAVTLSTTWRFLNLLSRSEDAAS